MDWDDLLPGGEAADGASDSGPSDAGGAVALVEPADPLRRQRPTYKSTWTEFIPTPKKRSRSDECLAASRMRDALAVRRSADSKDRIGDSFNDALVKLRAAGVLRDHGRTSVVRRGDGDVVIVAGNTRTRVPFETMLCVAYSKVKRVNDLCRSFGLHRDTISRVRVMTAHCSGEGDAEVLLSISSEFGERRPRAFSAMIMGDCTSHSLNLPMAGLEQHPHLTSSSWHVMSSMHRFSWLPNLESGLSREFDFCTVDFVRPNVALVSSEDHTCLYQAMYDVPQVSHFTSFEDAGCSADIAFLHYELDGFSANPFHPRAAASCAHRGFRFGALHHHAPLRQPRRQPQ